MSELIDIPAEGSQMRAEAALKMKVAGASWVQIAEHLDYSSAATARATVEKLIAESAEEFSDRDRLRKITNLRMDALMKVAFRRALEKNSPDQVAYMRIWLEYEKQLARLNGLDAPQQVVITPAYEEIVAWATDVYAKTGQEVVVEADIIEEQVRALEAEVGDE